MIGSDGRCQVCGKKGCPDGEHWFCDYCGARDPQADLHIDYPPMEPEGETWGMAPCNWPKVVCRSCRVSKHGSASTMTDEERSGE